jgi:hypothetical protein
MSPDRCVTDVPGPYRSRPNTGDKLRSSEVSRASSASAPCSAAAPRARYRPQRGRARVCHRSVLPVPTDYSCRARDRRTSWIASSARHTAANTTEILGSIIAVTTTRTAATDSMMTTRFFIPASLRYDTTYMVVCQRLRGMTRDGASNNAPARAEHLVPCAREPRRGLPGSRRRSHSPGPPNTGISCEAPIRLASSASSHCWAASSFRRASLALPAVNPPCPATATW